MAINKNKSRLLLVPSGGLGNRLRAIASAVQLAEATGTTLQMLWFKDWGMGARWGEIFKPMEHQSLREATLMDCLVYDRPRKRNLFVPRLFQSVLFEQRIDEREVTPLKHRNFDFQAWARGKKSYMSCYQDFGEVSNRLYSTLFHPIDELEQRIAANLAQLGESPIGIHVRRTDNVAATQRSPLSLFFEAMDAIVKANPAQRFYLATDDESTKMAMTERYGEALLMSSSKAERGTVEGIKDAVVEMFTLARCREIYGTADSSFSVIASRIGDIHLTILEM
jgi:hypothetical protein